MKLTETAIITVFLFASANSLAVPSERSSCGRKSFIERSFGLATSMVATSPVLPAQAKDINPAIKGTKEDPKYQACLSTCMYDCTKPKGDEQKSRSECLPECKKKCATTKAQLMTGAPKAE
jgi:hypothetical protein